MEKDTQMLELAAARPEFINLSETEVWQAIEKQRESNPVAAEVLRLAIDYMASFKAHFTQARYVPSRILHIDTRCPIERVALLVLVRFVEAEAGTACPITFH